VNGKHVIDEEAEVIQSILSTLTASRHPVDLVLLSLPHRTLAQYKTRLSQPPPANAQIDELGFSLLDITKYHHPNNSKFVVNQKKSQQLDKLWFEYLKSIGGPDNLKPAGVYTPAIELAQLVRRGIPTAFRPLLWKKLSLCDSLRLEIEKVVFGGHDGESRRNSRRLSGLTGSEKKNQAKYYPDVVLSEEWQSRVGHDVLKYIEMDLDRTFPSHPFFADREVPENEPVRTTVVDREESDMVRPMGQVCLRRLLTGFAAHNPYVGYCQSLNFIAAMCLLVERDEEDAFWLFLAMMERIYPKNYFTSNMSGSYVDQHVLQHLMSQSMPKLFIHIVVDNDIALPLVSTQWFLCGFLHTFTPSQTLRVWDVFMCEGSVVIFAIALALFKYFEKEIMSLSGGDLFCFLRDLGKSVLDIDAILALAFGESLCSFKSLNSSSLSPLYKRMKAVHLQDLPKELNGVGFVHTGAQLNQNRQDSVDLSRTSSTSRQFPKWLPFYRLVDDNAVLLQKSPKLSNYRESSIVVNSIAELHTSSRAYFDKRTAQNRELKEKLLRQQRSWRRWLSGGFQQVGFLFPVEFIDRLREIGLQAVQESFNELQKLRDEADEEEEHEVDEGNDDDDSLVGSEVRNASHQASRRDSCFGMEDLAIRMTETMANSGMESWR
jgi:hypothetical protein